MFEGGGMDHQLESVRELYGGCELEQQPAKYKKGVSWTNSHNHT